MLTKYILIILVHTVVDVKLCPLWFGRGFHFYLHKIIETVAFENVRVK